VISERIIKKVLGGAGVVVNGDNPWDIKVNNSRFYHRVLTEGSLGLGESYMEGWWDCPKLDQFFYQLLMAGVPWFTYLNPIVVSMFIKSKLMNIVPKSKAFIIGKEHYDLGNDLFREMLDSRMTYTGGYWKDATTLDAAQEAKLELVCRKIGLQKGQTVLDIGCGWASFAKYAAEKYAARVTGVTVSKEQVSLAQEFCKGLPVEIRLQDYRDVNERFDHIVSLGMFEHVGPKNYRTYMTVVEKCLRAQGLFLLHTIGARDEALRSPDPWIERYIFPLDATSGKTTYSQKL
jgi:cyclopropane-fatty-acyl-phospholipid synthase